MKDADRFFLIFIGTIVLIRIFLYVVPFHAPDIGSFDVHHYMYGIILLAVAYPLRSVLLYAVALALIVDELMLFPTGATTWEDYYSLAFISGTALLCALVYMLRAQLTTPLAARVRPRPGTKRS